MASDHYEKVKGYLLDLDLSITHENEDEELFVVEDEDNGIKNLIIDCEDPIVILEQPILTVEREDAAFYKRLLQMNRNLVHGAFVLDDAGTRVIFRDTLQLSSLDPNELEASISALSLALAENSRELLENAKRS